MPFNLTRCSINLEGSGTIWVNHPVEDVSANSEFCQTISVKPRKTGFKAFVVSFSSEEMIDINGSIKVDVNVDDQ